MSMWVLALHLFERGERFGPAAPVEHGGAAIIKIGDRLFDVLEIFLARGVARGEPPCDEREGQSAGDLRLTWDHHLASCGEFHGRAKARGEPADTGSGSLGKAPAAVAGG